MIQLPQQKNYPHWAIPATIASAIAILRWQGRDWFCACGKIQFWIADAQSSHTSQHLFDPYSFSHVQHGLVLFFFVAWAVKKWSWKWQLWLAIGLEAGWEILENTPMVINRYREATAALGYTGDSILNSMGDILSCAAGFMIARRLGWNATWVLFAAIEALMLVTIRDSLLLNVLMLVWPLEFIKTWQMAG
jgi:hypothetical protein